MNESALAAKQNEINLAESSTKNTSPLNFENPCKSTRLQHERFRKSLFFLTTN